ncbi:STAS domain-containing protein [Sediminibacillus dalangtanensis]|uniref:STAS domain-containing protein n=1 Tax=Sediminibacillus dalangtanensis TaxID=2729421 RepID=A0ABX7VSK0_9BACI|nr:STAS domain-containing protein [Sediminibacillus dalangtanensis]QTM98555.1 STAS domain-containing protein [Sediminibacillus dalangtanensis]
MSKQDELLYQYLIDHAASITDRWLQTRKSENGSIYSAHSDDRVETMLREQNKMTIEAVSSSLLADEGTVNKQVDEWARTIGESRVDSDTPIYEVIEAINKAENVFMEFVLQFIEENEEIVRKEDILRWNRKVNSAFNQMVTKFSEVYYRITTQRLFSQQELIHELSTPIIPVFESMAIAPLIGELDSYRAKFVMETIPAKCVEKEVDHLFIDLSGMPTIDTMIAQQIYQLTGMLKLLGISSTISGIRPEVAQTAVQLGIDFESTGTYSSLKQALLTAGLNITTE